MGKPRTRMHIVAHTAILPSSVALCFTRPSLLLLTRGNDFVFVERAEHVDVAQNEGLVFV